jgi:hypothetical protein
MPQVQLEHFGNGLRPWWVFYGNDLTEGPDKGKIWVSSVAARHGNNGLTCHVTQGNLYLYFKPWDEDKQEHAYAHELTQKGIWKPQTYNRLSLWLKTSRGLDFPTDGRPNFHLGMYTRAKSAPRREQETGNGHWYYHALLLPDAWNYLEVDLCHPHMQRNVYGPNGAPKEWGRRDTPNGRPGPWMADLMTSFYLDAKGKLPFTSQYFLDSVNFTTIPQSDPVEDIYGVTAAYQPRKGKLFVSWSQRMDRDWQPFSLYCRSGERMRRLDLAHLVATGIHGGGSGGHNQCFWQGQVGGSFGSPLYVAIHQHNHKKFRQIKVNL